MGRKAEKSRAVVVHPELPKFGNTFNPNSNRSAEARLEEAVGLTAAIELDVVAAEIFKTRKIRSSTLISGDAVARIHVMVHELELEVVIIDATLTPVQHRNLERAVETKVLDRTALILEIFGARARTKEGKLQVELAALSYQRSRLVRSWTHLERQRGGAGFMGGPGESQLEIDRRLIADRIRKLKADLEEVRRTRALHRKARQKIPYPIVSLVGYTNSGKSTLFNSLTSAGVLSKDMLFATLDPTLRQLELPSGRKVLLADTVGFISNLPHELVDAFKATLEEVEEANVIIHVQDMSQPFAVSERADVLEVLESLEIPEKVSKTLIDVANKLDLATEEQIETLTARISSDLKAADSFHDAPVWTSAVTGEGLDNLLATIDRVLAEDQTEIDFSLDVANSGQAMAWLHRNATVVSKDMEEELLQVAVKMTAMECEQFKQHFKEVIVEV